MKMKKVTKNILIVIGAIIMFLIGLMIGTYMKSHGYH